jgi:hypothetical protein
MKRGLLLLLLLIWVLPVDGQCAMCRAVLESEESGSVAKGINNGIMYLMVFPYLLVGTVGYLVYRNRQKVK